MLLVGFSKLFGPLYIFIHADRYLALSFLFDWTGPNSNLQHDFSSFSLFFPIPFWICYLSNFTYDSSLSWSDLTSLARPSSLFLPPSVF